MTTEQLALVQGWADTRATLVRWRRTPAAVAGRWAAISLAIAVGLLSATWALGGLLATDLTPWAFPGITEPATAGGYASIVGRNALVLALHAFACLAGFIAGSSLPQVADGYSGWWRRLHDHAGRAAMTFVAAATAFSFATQAWALAHGAASLAAQLGLSRAVLLLALTPHAIPELVALFLPLAAWISAGRRDRWEELLAATFVTVAVAVPVLLAAAAIEVWVTPSLLRLLIG